MQKIYKKQLLIIFSALCLGNASIQAQTCIAGGPNCGTTTQNFKSGQGNFTSTATGGNGSTTLTYSSADGDFRQFNAVANRTYTLTSPTYALTTDDVAFIGFDLAGTSATGIFVNQGICIEPGRNRIGGL